MYMLSIHLLTDVEAFSSAKNKCQTKHNHFTTTSKPVEGFSHEDSSLQRPQTDPASDSDMTTNSDSDSQATPLPVAYFMPE